MTDGIDTRFPNPGSSCNLHDHLTYIVDASTSNQNELANSLRSIIEGISLEVSALFEAEKYLISPDCMHLECYENAAEYVASFPDIVYQLAPDVDDAESRKTISDALYSLESEYLSQRDNQKFRIANEFRVYGKKMLINPRSSGTHLSYKVVEV